MKGSYSIGPPVLVTIGKGHWYSRSQAITIEVDDGEPNSRALHYQEFRLKMNDVIIYKGGGRGIEKFADYITSPNNPPEVRLIERLLK